MVIEWLMVGFVYCLAACHSPHQPSPTPDWPLPFGMAFVFGFFMLTTQPTPPPASRHLWLRLTPSMNGLLSPITPSSPSPYLSPDAYHHATNESS